jgi:hypothetical protein
MAKITKWIRENAPVGKAQDEKELAKDISRKVLKNKPKSSFENPRKQKATSFGELP